MNDHATLVKAKFLERLERTIDAHKVRMTEEGHALELSSWYGIDDGSSYVFPFGMFVMAYYVPGTPYYHQTQMLTYALESLTAYAPYLREDGSTDLYETNFHDPAQTGFFINWCFAAPVAFLTRLSAHTPEEDAVAEKTREVLARMGNAAATLGFHTANHRWVISAALSIVDAMLGEPRYQDVIDRFLMEGIDCDEYGEYTERSTGSYNMVCDHSFLLLAYFLNDASYLEYPRRNLRLMYHFIEPDLTVNTLNSSRWDQGGKYNIASYYSFYVKMALLDKDPEFAYMADVIASRFSLDETRLYAVNGVTAFFTLFPEYIEAQKALVSKPIAQDQTIYLPKSNIARVYYPSQKMTATLVCSRHPVFLQFYVGNQILQVRYAGSFFGDPHSQFRAQEIIPTADGYRLICDESAGYRSQLDEKPETSDWRHMDHSKRRIINIQQFRTEITVHLLPDGASLDLETSGCDRVPTRLELVMNPGGKLDSDAFAAYPKPGDYFFMKEGPVRYFIGDAKYFEFSGCFAKHSFAEHMRGAAPAEASKFTLAMTDITPQKSHIEIRLKAIY